MDFFGRINLLVDVILWLEINRLKCRLQDSSQYNIITETG
jgi:hypothetical protein